MPIGNCVTNLFKEGDYNVRTTVFKQRINSDPSSSYKAWIEIIRDSIGRGMICSAKLFNVIITLGNGTAYKLSCGGQDIIGFVKMFCNQPTSIRIDIKGTSNSRTWIVLLA